MTGMVFLQGVNEQDLEGVLARPIEMGWVRLGGALAESDAVPCYVVAPEGRALDTLRNWLQDIYKIDTGPGKMTLSLRPLTVDASR